MNERFLPQLTSDDEIRSLHQNGDSGRDDETAIRSSQRHQSTSTRSQGLATDSQVLLLRRRGRSITTVVRFRLLVDVGVALSRGEVCRAGVWSGGVGGGWNDDAEIDRCRRYRL